MENKTYSKTTIAAWTLTVLSTLIFILLWHLFSSPYPIDAPGLIAIGITIILSLWFFVLISLILFTIKLVKKIGDIKINLIGLAINILIVLIYIFKAMTEN